ncbi:MAG: MBL fold metallo-hydrolase [Thermoguttaceae bacterium]|nr:MBL fold metallo-hydrolase [Thermoguttaceae bacterium]
MNRREFIGSIGAAALMSSVITKANAQDEDAIAQWNRETELVAPKDYKAYLLDGNTRGFASLEKLEAAFEKVMREVKETVVTGDAPAVWSVYNMGYIVKTREVLFSIDLVHRRDWEFAPMLDFALITHNHGDHWRQEFYRPMNGAGKTVISNFLDNYGTKDWKKDGGFIRGVKTFKLKDVEIRTSLIDHNDYLIDFTTAFEIRIGDFILYHTGDSGRGTEPKLETVWGQPDLWLFFPGCGIDTATAVKKINAKRIVFGHLWELGHAQNHRGRLDEQLIRPRLVWAKEAGCEDVSLAFWGDRVL